MRIFKIIQRKTKRNVFGIEPSATTSNFNKKLKF